MEAGHAVLKMLGKLSVLKESGLIKVGDKVVHKTICTKRNGCVWVWEVIEVKAGVLKLKHKPEKAETVIWCKESEVDLYGETK